MASLSYDEESLRMCLLMSIHYMNVRGRQNTDGRTDTGRRHASSTALIIDTRDR